MTIPKVHIPGIEATVHLERIASGPEVRVRLVVDEEVARGTPIIRGDGPPFVLRDGRRITEQAEQRLGFRAVLGEGGHIAHFKNAHADRDVIAVTGCGNLGLNVGVRAWVDGRGYGLHGPEGGAIAVLDDAWGRRVDPSAHEDDGWTLSGPDLVRDGTPCISDVVTFADPRHRVLFPYTESESGARVDFGHDRLLANSALYADAAAGRPVTLALEHSSESVDRDALLRALAVKGYVEGDPASGRGCYVFPDDQHIRLSFLDGIYPHHVLAVDHDGRVASWLVSGLSNRAGTTIPVLARALADAGVRDAILLDNGGDVGLWRAPEKDSAQGSWGIRPAEPDREDAWPLSACLIWYRG